MSRDDDPHAVPWLGDVGEWAEWYLAVYRDLFLPILHRACPRDGMTRFFK